MKNYIRGIGPGSHPDFPEFDAIAFRGNSGAMVAPALAMELNKYLVMVRKPNDGSHSDARVEGVIGCNYRYLIVDDTVSSGVTVVTIQKEILRVSPAAECVGILTYNAFIFYTVEQMKNGFNRLWVDAAHVDRPFLRDTRALYEVPSQLPESLQQFRNNTEQKVVALLPENVQSNGAKADVRVGGGW